MTAAILPAPSKVKNAEPLLDVRRPVAGIPV